MWFCGLSAVTWCSRVLYAFARDGGMPLAGVWKRVSPRHHTPAPAIWLCAALAFVAAVYSGAYSVITSISVIGLYLSYIIPVWLAWRLRGTAAEMPAGPWTLGRWGGVVNLVAMAWVAFVSIILSLPDNYRTGKTIIGLTLVLALWWIVAERRRFQGPAWVTMEDAARGSASAAAAAPASLER
jgi:amino acid transporter